MQAFSNMPRNSTFKNILINLSFLVVYVFYLSLSNIYVALPPLLGLLFAKYSRDLRNNDFFGVFVAFLATLFFEVEKSSSMGILFVLFLFLSVVISRLALILQESSHPFRVVYIFLPYVFYFFILQVLTIIHHQAPLPFNLLILWYLFCESVIILWKK